MMKFHPVFLLIACILLLCHTNCRSYSERDLELRNSRIPRAGQGVFALKDIPKDVLLGYYGGKLINEKEYLELAAKDKWHYVMGLETCAMKNDGITDIDGAQGGNIFVKINYAPAPFRNVRFNKLCGPPYAEIYSIKPIRAGDELYVDYGPNYVYDFMEYPEVKKFFEEEEQKLKIKNKE